MFRLHDTDAEIFVPKGGDAMTALSAITHLAIGAHQDDVEMMAYHGILECYRDPGRGFGAVIVTNGLGSPRSAEYADYTDEEMCRVRREEQKMAALIGDYAVAALLSYPSGVVKDPKNPDVKDDLTALLAAARPEVVYTHNLADKHDTHVAVVLRTLGALRNLPLDQRPRRVLGCEVWRNLDWLPDEAKVVLECGGHPNLFAALVGVFDSQIAGGKRYDLATLGRYRANATFFDSHGADTSTALTFAMDLTPLILADTCDPEAYALEYARQFTNNISERIRAFS